MTQVVNQKRNTSFLLDETAILASLSVDRQPTEAVRLEVEIVGSTILSGLVTVYASTGLGVAEYVVTDDSDGNEYAIKITDGVINISVSASAASANPIVEDTLDTGQHYEIGTNNGVIRITATATVQDDSVILADTSDSNDRLLLVSNGAIGTSVQTNTSEQFSFSDNGCEAGTTEFSSIAGLTSSGISDGFVNIRAVNRLGQPVNQQKDIDSTLPVRFYFKDGRIRAKLSGQDRVANYKIMAEPDADVKDNDLVYAVSGLPPGLTIGQLSFTRHIYDFDGATHHIEAEVIDL